MISFFTKKGSLTVRDMARPLTLEAAMGSNNLVKFT